jgi:hypothetical protein
MRLCEALDVRRGDVVAFTGAGGKTSALVQLGYELAEQGWRVISTTTTKIAEQELSYFPCVVQWQPDLLQERGHHWCACPRDSGNGRWLKLGRDYRGSGWFPTDATQSTV